MIGVEGAPFVNEVDCLLHRQELQLARSTWFDAAVGCVRGQAESRVRGTGGMKQAF